MKAFSLRGPATKGFFGPNALTLGNPFPTQSSGATTVTFQIVAGFNGNGPFAGYTYSGGFGSTAGILPPTGDGAGDIDPDPTIVNGLQLVVCSSIENGGVLPRFICITLPGALAQSFFTSISLQDSGGNPYNLTTATADFNTQVVEPGYSVWIWPQPLDFPLASNTNIVITL